MLRPGRWALETWDVGAAPREMGTWDLDEGAAPRERGTWNLGVGAAPR